MIGTGFQNCNKLVQRLLKNSCWLLGDVFIASLKTLKSNLNLFIVHFRFFDNLMVDAFTSAKCNRRFAKEKLAELHVDLAYHFSD